MTKSTVEVLQNGAIRVLGTCEYCGDEVTWDHIEFPYLVDVAWDTHGLFVTVQSRDQRALRHGGATLADHRLAATRSGRAYSAAACPPQPCSPSAWAAPTACPLSRQNGPLRWADWAGQ